MSGESRQFRLSSVKTEDSAIAAMISAPAPVSLQGSRSMARFESESMRKRSMASASFSVELSDDNLCDEDGGSDDCAHFGDKKRRLTFEQVKTLERSFEVGNKLEPERKMQLARALGLQPRQIAVWFQNRRARWKTKQLEKDFDALKHDYTALKNSYDALLQENKQFKDEVQRLKRELLLNKEESKSKDRGSGGGGGSEIESQQTSTALFSPTSTSPMIKSEMHIKGREPNCHKNGGGGGGGCSSFVSEATSVINMDSPRTIDSPLSATHQITELRTPLAEQSEFYCPKMEEEEEERALIHQQEYYNRSLFYGMEEEHGPSLWEYWNPGL